MASPKRKDKVDTWDAVVDDISQVIPIPVLVVLIVLSVLGRIFGYI